MKRLKKAFAFIAAFAIVVASIGFDVSAASDIKNVELSSAHTIKSYTVADGVFGLTIKTSSGASSVYVVVLTKDSGEELELFSGDYMVASNGDISVKKTGLTMLTDSWYDVIVLDSSLKSTFSLRCTKGSGSAASSSSSSSSSDSGASDKTADASDESTGSSDSGSDSLDESSESSGKSTDSSEVSSDTTSDGTATGTADDTSSDESSEATTVSSEAKALIKAAKASVSIKKGKTAKIKLKSGYDSSVVKSVKYSSTKKTVVRVNSKGKIKALKKGKAYIKIKVTFTDGTTKTVKTKVTVK